MTRWFAKRFLHPEIVAEYNYIFLWDEDLGVTDFNPRRYVYGITLKNFKQVLPKWLISLPGFGMFGKDEWASYYVEKKF